MNCRMLGFFSLALVSSMAFAMDNQALNGKLLIRGRVIDVYPEASSSRLNLIGGHVNKITSQAVPELDFSYFFTPNIAAELILATSRHSVAARGTQLGQVNLGRVSALPPTLTAQYHFFPCDRVNPYAGIGVNYTYFYDISNGPVATHTTYQNTVGLALQLGVDFPIDCHWVFNIDFKQVYMEPKVHVHTALGRITTRVNINPAIFGAGFGYRF